MKSTYISMQTRAKFEKCREHMQIGYLCDAHPCCRGCDYHIPDNIFEELRAEEILKEGNL